MKAISVRCPNCAAQMSVQGTVSTATCSYCGTTSRVQSRTRVFEVPRKLPRANDPNLARLPVAVQKHTRRWVLGLVIGSFLFTGLIGAIPFFVANKVRSAVTSSGGGGSSSAPVLLYWSSNAAIPADVDGDHVADAVGRVRYVGGADRIALAAYSGASGKKIWESEPLGSYDETYRGTLGRAGDRLLFVDDRGQITGYSLDAGKPLWHATLGEKLESMCRAEGRAYLLAADERWLALDLESGKVSDASAAPDGCVPIATDAGDAHSGLERVLDWTSRDVVPIPGAIDGMRIETKAELGDGRWLGLGAKHPGTRVPMAALFELKGYEPPPPPDILSQPFASLDKDGKRSYYRAQRRHEAAVRKAAKAAKATLIWKAVIPAGDVMAVTQGTPDHFAVATDADCVFVAYEMQRGPIHAVCLSLKNGERRWDLAMPKAFIDNLGGVTAAGKRGFVVILQRLHILDLAAGKRLFSIGRSD